MTHRTPSLLTLLLCLAWLPAVAGAQQSYVQHQNLVYAEEHGVGLLMDVFVPNGPKNGRGIVDVASGAWHSDRGKIRDHEKAQMYQIYCAKGFTVFAVRPGSISKFSGPEMLNNLNTGIRWVKSHAADHGIDPNQLGLVGASAGGHLATLAMVTADDSTRVKAVAVFFPPTDFLDFGGKRLDQSPEGRLGDVSRALAFGPGQGEGKKPEDLTAALTAISPARLVKSGLPPYLTIHGDADPMVPLQQSQKMVEALKSKGNSAELIVKPGGNHPWPTIPEEVAVMADWFVKQLGVK
jgi:acetyl esterase/lipase